MAVDNNYNFSLTDVTGSINGSQSSLDDCFDDASNSGFNDSYYNGTQTKSLRAFRDYIELVRSPLLYTTSGSRVYVYYERGKTLYSTDKIWSDISRTSFASQNNYSTNNSNFRVWDGNSFEGDIII